MFCAGCQRYCVWVHLFELDAEQEKQAISALTDRSILDSFGQPLARVKTVVECVPLDAASHRLQHGNSTASRRSSRWVGCQAPNNCVTACSEENGCRTSPADTDLDLN